MSKPTMVDEEGNMIKQYWSCPIRFVPDSVWSFLKVQSFYMNHPSSPFPVFEKVNPRYLQAENILNSEIMRIKL